MTLNTIGTVPAEQLPKLWAGLVLLKIFFTVLFAYPASLAVALLRRIEK